MWCENFHGGERKCEKQGVERHGEIWIFLLSLIKLPNLFTSSGFMDLLKFDSCPIVFSGMEGGV